MTKPADFMIVIRHDIDPANIELMFPVVKTYTLETGTAANVIWCKKIDFSHISYLVAEALRNDKSGTVELHIPHWLVLTVAGSKNSPPVGFVWASESHEQPKALDTQPS